MSREENLSNTKRRISTKYPKQEKVYYRYGNRQEQALQRYKLKHGLLMDDTKITKLLDGILDEWFEKETIEEFCQEDPDLRIQMRKEKNKQLWIDFIYDCCDRTEIRALFSACGSILEYGSRVVSKIKIKNK